MEISVGAILEGTIKSITKFGAFVTLPGGRSGLVHISEIAHSYVENVSDFLSEGQTVKVKVVNIDEAGRINLSIKKATPPPPRPQGFSRDRQNRSSDFRGGNRGGSAPQGGRSYNNGGGQSGMKKNEAVEMFNKTNAQMLKLLAELGLKANTMLGGGDFDDEL